MCMYDLKEQSRRGTVQEPQDGHMEMEKKPLAERRAYAKRGLPLWPEGMRSTCHSENQGRHP